MTYDYKDVASLYFQNLNYITSVTARAAFAQQLAMSSASAQTVVSSSMQAQVTIMASKLRYISYEAKYAVCRHHKTLH